MFRERLVTLFGFVGKGYDLKKKTYIKKRNSDIVTQITKISTIGIMNVPAV